MRTIIGIFTAMSLVSCSMMGIRTAEQPKYKVLKKSGRFEVRRYEPVVVASTKTQGAFNEAQGGAFRVLAGYIFGKNETQQKIAMTAPVTRGEKISMTAPVTQTQSAEGEWEMMFVMPSQYTLETLPRPLDSRVELKTLPEQTIATIRYTWRGNKKRNREKGKELLDWLEKNSEFVALEEPYFAGYDPPWTIPFLRRNEMWVRVKPKQ